MTLHKHFYLKKTLICSQQMNRYFILVKKKIKKNKNLFGIRENSETCSSPIGTASHDDIDASISSSSNYGDTMDSSTLSCYSHPYQPLLLGRSSRWHLVFTKQIQVLGCRQTLIYPCVRVHRRILLTSTSLIIQQGPTYLLHLTLMVSKWCGYTTAVLRTVASRICSRQNAAFLCSSHVAFYQHVFFASMWCIHLVMWIQPQLGRKKTCFILSDQISI